MAGARVVIDLDESQVTPALARARAQLDVGGTTVLLEDIGEYLLRSTRERAARQVSPSGSAWAALSPPYKRYKDKKRPGVPKLKFDFHMLGDQLAYQVVGATLFVGTAAKYGATHQFGRGGIPARPWLGLSVEDDTEVLDIVGDHLRGAFVR